MSINSTIFVFGESFNDIFKIDHRCVWIEHIVRSPAPFTVFVPIWVFGQSFRMPANSISCYVGEVHIFHKAFVRVNAMHCNLFAIPLVSFFFYGNRYFDKLAIVLCEICVESCSCIGDSFVFSIVFLNKLLYVFRYRFDFLYFHCCTSNCSPNMSYSSCKKPSCGPMTLSNISPVVLSIKFLLKSGTF